MRRERYPLRHHGVIKLHNVTPEWKIHQQGNFKPQRKVPPLSIISLKNPFWQFYSSHRLCRFIPLCCASRSEIKSRISLGLIKSKPPLGDAKKLVRHVASVSASFHHFVFLLFLLRLLYIYLGMKRSIRVVQFPQES